MRKLFIVMLFTFTFVATNAQVILNNIEFGEDVPPTITVMRHADDVNKIMDIACKGIESRSTSYVSLEFQKEAYIVTYVNSIYNVTIIATEDFNSPMALLNHLETYIAIEPILFTSTRVSDVRKWMKDTLIARYIEEMQRLKS